MMFCRLVKLMRSKAPFALSGGVTTAHHSDAAVGPPRRHWCVQVLGQASRRQRWINYWRLDATFKAIDKMHDGFRKKVGANSRPIVS